MQLALDRPETPTRRRFDVDAYHGMAEAGILSPEDRVELIDGEIIEMAPIGSAHGGMTNRLTRLVAQAVADGRVLVSVQGLLHLDAHSELQHDLMLLRPRADDYTTSHPTAADVLLVVEVADSPLAYDRGPKLALYARHGVPEVWILDLAGRALEVCREPGGDGYADRRRQTTSMVMPALVPTLAIDVEALLA
jgi:Uma2 family endonuclease